MGSVTPYDTSDGKRYRVRYRKPDRSQTDKRGFKTKRDAELFLASVEVSKARGEFIDATAAKMTVGTLGATWMASLTHLKPSTMRVVEMAWRVHVEPVWGKREIGGVLHSDVQTWVSRMTAGDVAESATRKPLAATSVLRNYGILASILDIAVKDRRLAVNPARGVNLPKKVKKQRHYLTHEDVWALAAASKEHESLVLFLAYTGLRWGEATGLRVKHVDALRRRVKVVENAVTYGPVLFVGSPKSNQERSVPYPNFLSVPIAKLCQGKGRDDLLFGDGSIHMRRPNTSSNQTSWFIRALADVKLEPMTIHDLRHTAASLAISTGANVKAVQRMLGHASAAMTLDIYAGLFDDDLDAVGERLSDAAGADAADSARTEEDKTDQEGEPE